MNHAIVEKNDFVKKNVMRRTGICKEMAKFAAVCFAIETRRHKVKEEQK
jgi:hypothetical protein